MTISYTVNYFNIRLIREKGIYRETIWYCLNEDADVQSHINLFSTGAKDCNREGYTESCGNSVNFPV